MNYSCKITEKVHRQIGIVQDGSIGRFWIHCLPQTHQTYSYIWNNSLWKNLKNKKERATWRWIREAKTWSCQKPYTQGSWRDLLNTKLISEEQVVCASYQTLQPLESALDSQAQKCLASKINGAYVQEIQKAVGTKICSLRTHMQIHSPWGPAQKQPFEKCLDHMWRWFIS